MEVLTNNLMPISITVVVLLLVALFFILKSGNDSDDSNKKEAPFNDYGIFDSTRAKTEFGLDDDELKTFLIELKKQINTELPNIEKSKNEKDYGSLKNHVHMIKGSAVNLGEKGISQVLYDFNDYLSKDGKDTKIIEEFYQDIIYYNGKL